MLTNPHRLSVALRWSIVTTLRDRIFCLLAESQSWEKDTPHLTTVEWHDAQESQVLCQHRLIIGVALCLAFGTCHVLDHQEAEVGLRVGPLLVGYRLCVGEDQVRRSGLYLKRWTVGPLDR